MKCSQFLQKMLNIILYSTKKFLSLEHSLWKFLSRKWRVRITHISLFELFFSTEEFEIRPIRFRLRFFEPQNRKTVDNRENMHIERCFSFHSSRLSANIFLAWVSSSESREFFLLKIISRSPPKLLLQQNASIIKWKEIKKQRFGIDAGRVNVLYLCS